MWRLRRLSVSKAAEEVIENLEFETELLPKVKSIFDQNNYGSAKFTKKEHRKTVFVNDTETYQNERNGDCVLYSVIYFSA